MYVARAFIQLAQSWLKKTFQIAVLTPASDDFAANSTSGNLISQAFRNIAGAFWNTPPEKRWFAPGKGNLNHL